MTDFARANVPRTYLLVATAVTGVTVWVTGLAFAERARSSGPFGGHRHCCHRGPRCVRCGCVQAERFRGCSAAGVAAERSLVLSDLCDGICRVSIIIHRSYAGDQLRPSFRLAARRAQHLGCVATDTR